MCQRGQLRMVGIVNMNYAIGRMELCNDRVWRKICGWRWGANDAKVACQQMGFFDRGIVIANSSYSITFSRTFYFYSYKSTCKLLWKLMLWHKFTQ